MLPIFLSLQKYFKVASCYCIMSASFTLHGYCLYSYLTLTLSSISWQPSKLYKNQLYHRIAVEKSAYLVYLFNFLTIVKILQFSHFSATDNPIEKSPSPLYSRHQFTPMQ